MAEAAPQKKRAMHRHREALACSLQAPCEGCPQLTAESGSRDQKRLVLVQTAGLLQGLPRVGTCRRMIDHFGRLAKDKPGGSNFWAAGAT